MFKGDLMLASKMERKIHNILANAGIPFEEEYSFNDLVSSSNRKLYFDFAIFDDEGELLCLIEAQGRQHYQPVEKFGGQKGLARQQYNDTLKRRYCLKHNYKLISIP
jgi:hypothetical protein